MDINEIKEMIYMHWDEMENEKMFVAYNRFRKDDVIQEIHNLINNCRDERELKSFLETIRDIAAHDYGSKICVGCPEKRLNQ